MVVGDVFGDALERSRSENRHDPVRESESHVFPWTGGCLRLGASMTAPVGGRLEIVAARVESAAALSAASRGVRSELR